MPFFRWFLFLAFLPFVLRADYSGDDGQIKRLRDVPLSMDANTDFAERLECFQRVLASMHAPSLEVLERALLQRIQRLILQQLDVMDKRAIALASESGWVKDHWLARLDAQEKRLLSELRFYLARYEGTPRVLSPKDQDAVFFRRPFEEESLYQSPQRHLWWLHRMIQAGLSQTRKVRNLLEAAAARIADSGH